MLLHRASYDGLQYEYERMLLSPEMRNDLTKSAAGWRSKRERPVETQETNDSGEVDFPFGNC